MNKKILVIAVSLAALVLIITAAVKIKSRGPVSPAGKSGSINALLNQVKESETKNDLTGAREAYLKLISEYPGSQDVMKWQKKVEGLNISLLFSPALTPKSTMYEIKPGDTLTKISKEFKTTPELIKKSNNMANDKIIPGRKIKVWAAPFTIFVDKSQNMLILKSDDEVFKTYIVSTGANNSTPVGTFKVVNKLKNPTWFKAGAVVPSGSPDNILGTAWLGIDVPGYGIHGTTEPGSLGQQVTQGCVRMANPDVDELYIIVPVGTEVTIVD